MNTTQNPYLTGKIPATFIKTALPIIIVMVVNGLYNLVDAYFLGTYVGEQALSAVTLAFPLQMLLFAFATLCANGMASVLARHVGAKQIDKANQVFSHAHIMVVTLFIGIIVLYTLFGQSILRAIVGDSPELLALTASYITILVFASPITGILSVNTDALRSEGKVEFMSMVMLLSAILNVVFDYILIAKMDMGVPASAYATVLAQVVSLVLIMRFRASGKSILSFDFSNRKNGMKQDIQQIIPLGIPTSLSYIGISLTVGVINYNVQMWSGAAYADVVAAHGIVTRLMTFAVLPLIGINVAFQTIVGNNFGAKQLERTNQTVTFGLKLSLIYCALIQAIFIFASFLGIGGVFVENQNVIDQTSHILVIMSAGFFLFGPMMLLSGYFQAIGNAKNAIILGLSKTYLFTMPLIFIMPYFQGELGIWLAAPVADLLALGLAISVLLKYNRNDDITRGLYFKAAS